MKKLLTTLACAAVAMATSAIAGEYPDISINELKAAIKDGKVTVIDVNGSASYAKRHIPTSVDFRATEDLATVLPKEKDALVVAYCGGPACNAYKAAAKKAEALGYTNVKHLSAGISGWLQAGEKVDKKS